MSKMDNSVDRRGEIEFGRCIKGEEGSLANEKEK